MRQGLVFQGHARLRAVAAVLAILGTSAAAEAQTCLKVDNVEAWDFLNIRKTPSHLAGLVAAITPGTPAVMWVTGPCVPRSETPTRRWCPVEYFPLPDVRRTGYVKAFFTTETACPAFKPAPPPPAEPVTTAGASPVTPPPPRVRPAVPAAAVAAADPAPAPAALPAPPPPAAAPAVAAPAQPPTLTAPPPGATARMIETLPAPAPGASINLLSPELVTEGALPGVNILPPPVAQP